MARREGEWWHTIDLSDGQVTRGFWDLRHAAGRMPWPEPLRGLRCLDVGTMDGFWAFEMERRGAGEVVAIDVVDPSRQDWPFALRELRDRALPRRGAAFAAAAERLGSQAAYVDCSVYDLPGAGLGRFDLVFVGYVLELVRDPFRALDAVREVCRGYVIVLDQVSLWLSRLHRQPLARVAPRPGFAEWLVCNRQGLTRMVELAGFDVEAVTGFLRDRPGPAFDPASHSWRLRARHALGFDGRSAAVRAGRVVDAGGR